MKKVDFLLVGQGLAGSMLGYYLLKAGCRVCIINQSKKKTASQAAAGLYNPVTGRKMVKTWLADDIFPLIEPTYQKLEQVTQTRFLHPIPIYRPFLSNAERTEWSSKSANPTYQAYIEQVHQRSHFSEFIDDPMGGIVLQNSGYVDLPAFLSGMMQYFKNLQVYQEGFLDVTQVRLEKSGVICGEIAARQLIFCDGAEGYRNSFFHWLPYRPVKGEMLLIDTEKKSNIVFNRGVFLIPQGTMYKVGSTYDQQDISFSPTPKGRAVLQEKLDKFLKIPYRVVDHWAGVRPATRDRRPFVGIHPYHKTLGIFNGLGTKGVSLAPYFAQQFVDHLLENKSLNEEADISRFERFYHAIS